METKPEELLDFEIAKAETIKRRQFNPYRKIMGKIPTQVEMASWSYDKWMDLLRFALIFIEKSEETGDEMFKITDEKRKQLDDYLKIPDHPFQEFIYRVDLWLTEATNRQYYYKLTTLTRVCLTYIKKHPSIVDDNMRILLQSYPKRLGWVLSQYRVVETRAGELVQRDAMIQDGNATKAIPLPSVQVKLMNSILNISDLYERISQSIDTKDINKMKLDEKIKALKDLSFIFATATKKQSSNHFSQININTKDAKGVEEAMLDFIKKSNEK
jgi:hypothetical protein